MQDPCLLPTSQTRSPNKHTESTTSRRTKMIKSRAPPPAATAMAHTGNPGPGGWV